MVLKFIYSIFIGVLFATLVGVGIAAFYISPKSPDYPTTLTYTKPLEQQTTQEQQQMQQKQNAYEAQMKLFQKKVMLYNRNVSIIALIAAIIALVVSLTFFKQLLLISDGLLLGGLLTLIYSIFRGFATDDNMFRFIVVAIGFITAIIVGYIKFVPNSVKKTARSK